MLLKMSNQQFSHCTLRSNNTRHSRNRGPDTCEGYSRLLKTISESDHSEDSLNSDDISLSEFSFSEDLLNSDISSSKFGPSDYSLNCDDVSSYLNCYKVAVDAPNKQLKLVTSGLNDALLGEDSTDGIVTSHIDPLSIDSLFEENDLDLNDLKLQDPPFSILSYYDSDTSLVAPFAFKESMGYHNELKACTSTDKIAGAYQNKIAASQLPDNKFFVSDVEPKLISNLSFGNDNMFNSQFSDTTSYLNRPTSSKPNSPDSGIGADEIKEDSEKLIKDFGSSTMDTSQNYSESLMQEVVLFNSQFSGTTSYLNIPMLSKPNSPDSGIGADEIKEDSEKLMKDFGSSTMDTSQNYSGSLMEDVLYNSKFSDTTSYLNIPMLSKPNSPNSGIEADEIKEDSEKLMKDFVSSTMHTSPNYSEPLIGEEFNYTIADIESEQFGIDQFALDLEVGNFTCYDQTSDTELYMDPNKLLIDSDKRDEDMEKDLVMVNPHDILQFKPQEPSEKIMCLKKGESAVALDHCYTVFGEPSEVVTSNSSSVDFVDPIEEEEERGSRYKKKRPHRDDDERDGDYVPGKPLAKRKPGRPRSTAPKKQPKSKTQRTTRTAPKKPTSQATKKPRTSTVPLDRREQHNQAERDRRDMLKQNTARIENLVASLNSDIFPLTQTALQNHKTNSVDCEIENNFTVAVLKNLDELHKNQSHLRNHKSTKNKHSKMVVLLGSTHYCSYLEKQLRNRESAITSVKSKLSESRNRLTQKLKSKGGY